VCSGLTFRRLWYHIREPSTWVGKALCVRPAWEADVNTCQTLQPGECTDVIVTSSIVANVRPLGFCVSSHFQCLCALSFVGAPPSPAC